MIKFKPILNKILVRCLDKETQTSGGILLPESAKEKRQTGKVIRVNDEAKKSGIKENDTIIFINYAGTEIKIEGIDYLVMNTKDVLALIIGD